MSTIVCITLACLAPFWASASWEEWHFPPSTTFLPFYSLFLLWSIGSAQRDWVDERVGGLVCAAFPSTLPPAWDSNNFRRLELVLHCIPMASGISVASWLWLTWTERRWLKSPARTSRASSWLRPRSRPQSMKLLLFLLLPLL